MTQPTCAHAKGADWSPEGGGGGGGGGGGDLAAVVETVTGAVPEDEAGVD